MSDRHTGPWMDVTFQSRGRSGRIWLARFECGSAAANHRAAVEVAWKMNARIITVIAA